MLNMENSHILLQRKHPNLLKLFCILVVTYHPQQETNLIIKTLLYYKSLSPFH